MKMTHSGGKIDHLTILNTSKVSPQTSAPGVHLLEIFPNQYPHRAYVISVMFPEYTSLCPFTGQPVKAVTTSWKQEPSSHTWK